MSASAYDISGVIGYIEGNLMFNVWYLRGHVSAGVWYMNRLSDKRDTREITIHKAALRKTFTVKDIERKISAKFSTVYENKG